ncbi:short-chain dehydrogenase TIC 32, chloroplastic-like isoform X1 [Solanum stenotomum]|uniref:short-chain dehydrogenase TIC 32, chloroplastic-like isoform X1 n=1 Tax=Solanum stenotomum TaxID=172797 RepID=UPI0020D0BE18|nr:short-chain dehydrogenase TIC 32, chloroplastic-like isoform X1 [Solanum stenotomum]
MWIFGRKGTSGFSCCSTAEEVTKGINGFGLTAIVTGATSGIGMETTRVLALHGVHVIVAVRNMENGKKIKENILKSIPNAKIDFMDLNLSSMESIRKFAKEYNSAGHPLNLLINNAGVMIPSFTLSQDKIELQFAVNHLGHFLLTNLLLENMKNTAKNSKKEGRIVNVASAAHDFAYSQGIIFDKINDKESYNKFHAYGQSKLANILHANELAKRLKEEGVNISANSVHPGPIATNIMRYNNPYFTGIVNWIGRYVLKNFEHGASTTCYVALHPQVKGVSGEYFSDNNIAINKTTSLAKDSDLAKKVWEFSLDLTK